MFTLLRKMTHNGFLNRSVHTDGSYEDAVKALCLTLQSNADYLQAAKKHPNDPEKLKETEKYLLRSGVTLEQLDGLSVIHVAGTKGKGSTCAYTEAILRQHGFSTGFFSSPHLVSVRERIRLNGAPISQLHFARCFWNVYRSLYQQREHESDMPTYFKFLTLLTFHVFLEANVDVAIIEVGIGGELDCTNILRNPACVGVTSLGLDHTSLLGNTLQEIAYQKSGIFKPHAMAFTVPQPESAMCVLRKRAVEKQCRSLRVVPAVLNRKWNDVLSSAGANFSGMQQQNASLAVNMALAWMNSWSDKSSSIALDKFANNFLQNDTDDLSRVISLDKIALALASCKWPGRVQILRTSIADFYLDGAHTVESVVNCASWFKRASRRASRKFLIFNTTGDRNSSELLKPLRSLDFEKAYFVPNCAGITSIEDLTNHAAINEQRKRCEKHCELWGKDSVLKSSITEALFDVRTCASATSDKVEILVTGSLHLVGALLTVLDPNLTMTSDL
ncbi:hypothetical protein DMN91_006055 [Ooceraea biroi]|uniref:Folylpolyglutamate synthase n=1 Tax=Ooceraea biroi TaxID=2015173 RepID=A0A026WPW1_OOCBI|nr:folylpolyglutamate synthase, mitochondrial [Ooceraea biroi]EZA58018.1 Folylpolyglutamate synthase, mitochondrial [Ooceraea biroi]RLU21679.1 hypothetical protein DMN91_006055 [Ooceraea biroi]